MNLIIIIIVAISLSMDAFSLSLAYGTIGLSKEDTIKLTLIVSLYHFVMPLLGLEIGNLLMNYLPISPDMIVFFVLVFIGCQMLVESFKEEDIDTKMTLWNLFAFGFAVSLDSFSVGIGLSSLTTNYISSCVIFSLFSGLFTYLGLSLGKYMNQLIGKTSTILGGITLIVLGIIYLF